MDKDAVKQAALQALAQATLPEREVSERAEQALFADYWRELSPGLSIESGKAAWAMEGQAISADGHREVLRTVETQGYAQSPPVLSSADCQELCKAIDVLREKGWPEVFAFVYDEFWLPSRAPSLVRVLSEHLGAGYRQLPHIWAHYVYPQRGAAGWPPHMDNFEPRQRVTVWIALSDATLENGCLYFLPRDLVSPELARRFAVRKDPLEKQDVRTLLQNAHAVPAPAGSILFWDQDVIHWGGTATRTGAPRVSISQEFIAADAPIVEEGDNPLLALDPVPAFSQRLAVITECILTYRQFVPRMSRFAGLAQEIQKRLPKIAH